MAGQQTQSQKVYGDTAPALADCSDKVLFGDVWERPGWSKRDRSLTTVASLVALTNELPAHVKRGLDNGVTRDRLVELVTHLAVYGGWPVPNTAVPVLHSVFAYADNAGASDQTRNAAS